MFFLPNLTAYIWGYHSYGYAPSGVVGVVLLVIVALLLTGPTLKDAHWRGDNPIAFPTTISSQ